MSSTRSTPADLFAEGYWRKLGGEGGRRNEPRAATGPATARSLLRAAWMSALRARRISLLEELDSLNKRRMNARRRLAEVQAQAASDPRQAAALPMLMGKDRELADERDLICEKFLRDVEMVTERAHECDATWRAENERHRDRRLNIAPTELTLPADIVTFPPDPFA